MSTMTRFDQLGALLSEDCYSPTRMANRGFTITGEPTVWVSARGKNLTCFNGTDEKATWVGKIGTIKAISFWFICKSNNEQFFDFDGGTHTIDSAVGVIRANGWNAPTIYVDGAATGIYSLNVLHHCVITSATGFDASSFKIGTDNTSYGAVAIADVVLFGTVVTAAEALLLATDKLFRYDESLVSDWDFSTTNPRDRKGTNNGSGTGLVAATDVVEGPYGSKAIELNGSDEFVTVTNPTTLNFTTQDFSIELLLKANAATGFKGIVGRSSTPGWGWDIAVSNAQIRILTAQAAAYQVTDYNGMVVGKWQHWVFTRSGAAATITLDGVRVTPTNTGVHIDPVAQTSDMTIGGWVAGTYLFPGLIGVLRIYSGAALSALQASDRWNRIRQGR